MFNLNDLISVCLFTQGLGTAEDAEERHDDTCVDTPITKTNHMISYELVCVWGLSSVFYNLNMYTDLIPIQYLCKSLCKMSFYSTGFLWSVQVGKHHGCNFKCWCRYGIFKCFDAMDSHMTIPLKGTFLIIKAALYFLSHTCTCTCLFHYVSEEFA